jgi:hypothetical protein
MHAIQREDIAAEGYTYRINRKIVLHIRAIHMIWMCRLMNPLMAVEFSRVTCFKGLSLKYLTKNSDAHATNSIIETIEKWVNTRFEEGATQTYM